MYVRGVYKVEPNRYEPATVPIPESIQTILNSLEYDNIHVEVQRVHTHAKRYIFTIEIPEDSLMENLEELKKYVTDVAVWFVPTLSIVFSVISI